MMNQEQAAASKGMLEKLKEYADPKELQSRLGLSYENVIHVLTYGGIGFVAGFLFKKFGRLFVMSVVIVGAALLALSYLDMVSLNFDKFRSLLGISGADTVESVARHYYDLVRSNLLATVSGAVGFFIGYKVR